MDVFPEFLRKALIPVCCALASACSEPPGWHATDISGVLPDLEFRLVNEDGRPAVAADYRGKITLLYFGFTHCPGICPATLGHLSAALGALGADAEQVQVLLVSVDPQRDTPAVMKTYTDQFGPWLHGLTGPEADLRALNRAYKVDFSNMELDAGGNYDVAHSNVVFAFDALGRCRLLMRDTADTAAVVSDLRRLLGAATAWPEPGASG